MDQRSSRKSIPESLPASTDEGFWGDGLRIPAINEVFKAEKEHEWHQKGNVAICYTCRLRHGVYLDDEHEVREGKIVKKPSPLGKKQEPRAF